jgi:molecular chaperone GrpE
VTSGHPEQPSYPEQPSRPGRPEGTFGDAAAEMPNETEVESPLPADAGEGAPADGRPDGIADAGLDDISGVDDWVEEGGPLEPADLVDAAGADPGDGGELTDEAEADELTVAQMALQERTLDLQRLQAEFLNYKRRVERDRDLIKQNATYAALAPITEVLDTIDRAREHEELDGGLRTVADQLERTVAASGLVKFGAPGDAFDPTVHEALSSMGPDEDVTVTTVKVVAKSGYKIGDRVVRAAQVLTVEPA